jgi:hypothetical protein
VYGGYAYWVSRQVTAWPLYGGIVLFFAMGAVVAGVPTTSHTPLSGQVCPVLAVVPIGATVPPMSTQCIEIDAPIGTVLVRVSICKHCGESGTLGFQGRCYG